ncbi:hypothetical protein AAC387_Pa02g2894 [Persea americana]
MGSSPSGGSEERKPKCPTNLSSGDRRLPPLDDVDIPLLQLLSKEGKEARRKGFFSLKLIEKPILLDVLIESPSYYTNGTGAHYVGKFMQNVSVQYLLIFFPTTSQD